MAAQHAIPWSRAILTVDHKIVTPQYWTLGGLYRCLWWVVRSDPFNIAQDHPVTKKRGRRRKQGVFNPAGIWPDFVSKESDASALSNVLPPLLAQLHRDEWVRGSIGCTPAPLYPQADEASVPSPWLHRTGWHLVFGKVRRDMLSMLTRLPSREIRMRGLRMGAIDDQMLTSSPEHKARLSVLLQYIDSMFDWCEKTDLRTARPLLCRLCCFDPNKVQKEPFQLVG